MKSSHTIAPLCASLLLAACMHEQPVASCTVEGEKHLPDVGSSQEICERFRARLSQSVEPASLVNDLSLRITATPEGSITADARSGDGLALELAVDVMDRNLNASDLDRLADDLAIALNTDKPTA